MCALARNDREFDAAQEIRTPPATSVRTGGTPLVNAGGKASNRPCALIARQIPIYLPDTFRQ